MAGNGAKHGGPPKPDKEDKGIKDETIAKAAGVVIGVGIAWSLFRSITGGGKGHQHVHTQGHGTKEVGDERKRLRSKVEHAGKEIVDTLEGAGRALKDTLIGAGREGKVELDGTKKDIEHNAERAGKEVDSKTKKVAHSAEHKGMNLKGTVETAGSELSHLGHKKFNGKTVQVHSGDTLWAIARKYGVSVEALIATNRIQDGHSIVAGETIVIPK